MIKSLSDLAGKLGLKRSEPAPPDPDGDELARILFSLPDPIEEMAPLGTGSGLGAPTRIGQPTLAQTKSQARARLMESTALFFVARPESLRALREKGHICKEPDGSESAVQGTRSIPFFGYASASMDDRHWGLELRRLGVADISAKELHALRESAADHMDDGFIPRKGAKSSRPRV